VSASEPLLLDGSRGEGGGAVLRQALGLAVYAGRAIRIVRVRARRPRPGLQRQHLTAVKAASLLSGAHVEGAVVGSQEILFAPGPRRSGEWELDVGTAGAVTLVLQAVLLPALALPGRTRFTLTGGTDTTWAPPVDYLDRVALPALRSFGAGEISVARRGYYPRGGGHVVASFDGSDEPLEPLVYDRPPRVERLAGLGHAAVSLQPRRVAERQAEAAREELAPLRLPLAITTRYSDALSAGSGLVLWTVGSTPPLGGSALGAPRRRAEDVGAAAARELLRELESGAAVDRHLADQLVPFLAVAGGRLRAREITGHARSNVDVARAVIGAELRIDEATGVIESGGAAGS
jgi:RNA 3'-terminal phosphate cyclase (GTP)